MDWPLRGCADGVVGNGLAAMLFTGALVATGVGRLCCDANETNSHRGRASI
jgi:hypothetical protein